MNASKTYFLYTSSSSSSSFFSDDVNSIEYQPYYTQTVSKFMGKCLNLFFNFVREKKNSKIYEAILRFMNFQTVFAFVTATK